MKQNLSPGFTLAWSTRVELETLNSAILDAANRWRWWAAGASNTWQNIFSDLQNIFLALATIPAFVNLFGIYKIIFVDSIILLRFVIVFQISLTLQRWFPKNITIWNSFSDFKNIFSDFVNILGLSLVGFRNILYPSNVFLKYPVSRYFFANILYPKNP